MLEIVEIGRLMDELEVEVLDAAAIVDMHHFVGFDLKEIAGKTGLTDRQVRRRCGKWPEVASGMKAYPKPSDSRSWMMGEAKAPASSGLFLGSNS